MVPDRWQACTACLLHFMMPNAWPTSLCADCHVDNMGKPWDRIMES